MGLYLVQESSNGKLAITANGAVIASRAQHDCSAIRGGYMVRWYIAWVVMTLVSQLTILPHVNAAEFSYEDYQQGTALVTDIFMDVYQDFIHVGRWGEVLKKCGYKKESDELIAYVKPLVKAKIDARIKESITAKKLKTMGAVSVASEGVLSTWTG